MNLNTTLLVIIIILMLFILLKKHPETKTETHYHYDTALVSVPIVVNAPASSVPQTIPQDVDTAAILKKYFTIHYYRDTIRDSSLVAYIADSIGFNRLLHRSFSYRINRPTTVNTFQKEKKIRLFIGGYSTFDSTANVGISAAVQLKGWQVEAGRNLNNKQYLIGIKKEL